MGAVGAEVVLDVAVPDVDVLELEVEPVVVDAVDAVDAVEAVEELVLVVDVGRV